MNLSELEFESRDALEYQWIVELESEEYGLRENILLDEELNRGEISGYYRAPHLTISCALLDALAPGRKTIAKIYVPYSITAAEIINRFQTIFGERLALSFAVPPKQQEIPNEEIASIPNSSASPSRRASQSFSMGQQVAKSFGTTAVGLRAEQQNLWATPEPTVSPRPQIVGPTGSSPIPSSGLPSPTMMMDDAYQPIDFMTTLRAKAFPMCRKYLKERDKFFLLNEKNLKHLLSLKKPMLQGRPLYNGCNADIVEKRRIPLSEEIKQVSHLSQAERINLLNTRLGDVYREAFPPSEVKSVELLNKLTTRLMGNNKLSQEDQDESCERLYAYKKVMQKKQARDEHIAQMTAPIVIKAAGRLSAVEERVVNSLYHKSMDEKQSKLAELEEKYKAEPIKGSVIDGDSFNAMVQRLCNVSHADKVNKLLLAEEKVYGKPAPAKKLSKAQMARLADSCYYKPMTRAQESVARLETLHGFQRRPAKKITMEEVKASGVRLSTVK